MVYDRNADATSAVTAFLTQFQIKDNGDIRYVSGNDTFHVWWLHRALQKIAWDFTVSGDDEINLTKPNPSTSAALGMIITLLDHTADYGVKYNITDTEAEYLFGGSVEQGTTRYSGLKIVGSVNNPNTELQIIQNNALLPSHWGTGKNQTSSSILARILIKTIDAGSEIDGSRVIVKANEWGDTYAVWRTQLGIGEAVAAINTAADPQNTTDLATVQGYTGITRTEGYTLIDIGDGSGEKPYYIKWDRGTHTKKELYEYVKSLMVRGTNETLFGIDGDLFTGGATFKCNVDNASGTFVQNEEVTWGGGSGILMAADDLSSPTQLWIHILTGENPEDNDTLSGASATADIDGTVTSLIPSPIHIGQFTGSAFLADYGVGFEPSGLTKDDSLIPLDSSTPINPPNLVSVTVSVSGTTHAHVFLARATNGVIDQTQYKCAAGNRSGNTTFVIKETIDTDTPTDGWILIKEGTTFEPIEYSSWSGSTFTLVGSLSKNYTEDKDVIIPFLYDDIDTDGGSHSASIIQSVDIPVAGWVRQGTPTAPGRPVPISGVIGAAGYMQSVTIESE